MLAPCEGLPLRVRRGERHASHRVSANPGSWQGTLARTTGPAQRTSTRVWRHLRGAHLSRTAVLRRCGPDRKVSLTGVLTQNRFADATVGVPDATAAVVLVRAWHGPQRQSTLQDRRLTLVTTLPFSVSL